MGWGVGGELLLAEAQEIAWGWEEVGWWCYSLHSLVRVPVLVSHPSEFGLNNLTGIHWRHPEKFRSGVQIDLNPTSTRDRQINRHPNKTATTFTS